MRFVRWVVVAALFSASFVGCGCDREVYVRQSGSMITVNPSHLDFGQIPQGLVVTQTIEILNPGQNVLIIESTKLNDENEVFMVTVPQDQVGISDAMDIVVVFSPTAIQKYEATFTISTDAENEKLSLITIEGEGIPDSICGDCDDPPEDRCMSAYELLIYDNVGACVDDQCQYQASQIYCEFGCDEEYAICLDDPGTDPPVVDAGVEPEPELDAGTPTLQPDIDAGPYEGPEVEEVHVGHDGWTCARLSNGRVDCWGKNKGGQLGIGEWDGIPPQPEDGGTPLPAYSINPTPVTTILPESATANALSTGTNSTMVAMDDGDLYCWGSCPHRRPTNHSGQNIHTPEVITMATTHQNIDVGWGHACATSAAGDMECWGSNWFGGLGTGSDVYPEDQPVQIAQLNNVIQVALGRWHTCVLQENNKLYCWGWNRYHQVAPPANDSEYCPDTVEDNNPTLCVLTPREIEGLGSGEIVDMDSGGSHTCVIMDSGKVFCWGNNQSDALGDDEGAGFVWHGEPTETLDLGQPAVKLALGANHTLAIMEDGSLKAWGSNNSGQLGDGTAERQGAPVSVVGLPLPVLQLSTGASHTCAVLSDHSVWCWGKNEWGQLGDGSSEDRLVPVRVTFPE